MAMREPICLLLALALAGCAAKSTDIATSSVSPLQYRGLDCDQIGDEMQRVSARVNALGGQLDQKATDDAGVTAIGIILFWPALFFVGGNKGQEAEYGRLKGEHEALHQVAIQKRCGIPAPVAAPVAVPISAESPAYPSR